MHYYTIFYLILVNTRHYNSNHYISFDRHRHNTWCTVADSTCLIVAHCVGKLQRIILS